MQDRLKDKMNKISSAITISITVIIEIVWTHFIPIDPIWLKHIVGAIISLLISMGLIYSVSQKIAGFLWKKKNKSVYLGGDWFIVYSGQSFKQDRYLRVGTLRIEQHYDEIEMMQMTGHTPRVENGVVNITDYMDAIDGERTSTGAGRYLIDVKTKTLVGEYVLQRQEPHHIKINGFSQGTILTENGVPYQVRGEFFNGETGRSNGRPSWGKICMFKKQEDYINECQKIINS